MDPPAPPSPHGGVWAAGSGRLEVGLAGLGTLRWVAVDITLLLEEARRRLDLSPIAAVALGRSLTAAALLQRISFKVPARLVLEVMGDGPLGKVVAEADSSGRLRGMVGNRRLPTPEDGRMRIAPLVGQGFLRVTREGRRGRYSSQVALVSGELGSDLAHYLEQSEQIRSAVLLGVLPKPTGIAAAGGLVVEALPGTEDRIIDRLEANIGALEGVSFYLDRGGIPALAEAVLEGFEREVVESQALEYRCRCTRQGLLSQLLPLAQQDLAALVREDGTCEASCVYCGSRYVYAAEEFAITN
ncbi:MAG: Hsp33 family molecular chaperone HslO [Thermoanaerobaculia bacterium]